MHTQGLPLLVMCNKADVASAMQSHEVVNALGISELTGRDFRIQSCSAVRNQGVEVGGGLLAGWLLQIPCRALVSNPTGWD